MSELWGRTCLLVSRDDGFYREAARGGCGRGHGHDGATVKRGEKGGWYGVEACRRRTGWPRRCGAK